MPDGEVTPAAGRVLRAGAWWAAIGLLALAAVVFAYSGASLLANLWAEAPDNSPGAYVIFGGGQAAIAVGSVVVITVLVRRRLGRRSAAVR